MVWPYPFFYIVYGNDPLDYNKKIYRNSWKNQQTKIRTSTYKKFVMKLKVYRKII